MNETSQLRRKLLLLQGIILLLFCLVVTAGVSIPLYQHLSEEVIQKFTAGVDRQVTAVSQWVLGIRGLARQVTSRTRIRQELQKYNKGLVTLEELQAFSTPKLEDAMRLSDEAVGITRLDARGRAVVSLGIKPPSLTQPCGPSARDEICLGPPFQSHGRTYIWVRAPIKDRKGAKMGDDLVVVNTAGLDKLLRCIADPQGGQMAWGTFLVLNAPGGLKQVVQRQPCKPEQGRQGLIDIVLSETQKIAAAGGTAQFMTNGLFCVATPVEGAPWILISCLWESQIDGPIFGKIAEVALMALALYAICLAGYWYALRPLSRSILLKQSELAAEIDRKTASLQEELAARERAEQARKESERRLSKIFQASPAAMAIVDFVSSRYVSVNDAYLKLTGYTEEEMIGRTTLEMDVWGENEARRRVREELQDRGRSQNIETLINTKDGVQRTVILSTELLYIQGRPHVVAAIQDITDRKLAEDEVRSLSRFPEENPSPVMRATADGTIIFANQVSMPLLAHWGTEVGGRLPSGPLEGTTQALATGKPVDLEVAALNETFAFNIAPVMNEGYANLYGMDITERKCITDALCLSEEQFRTTLYSIGDAVITTDTQSKVRHMNPVAEALTGWSEEEGRGRPLEEVFNIVNEHSGDKVANPADQVMARGMIVGLANHTILIARDGTRRPIADSGAPIRDGEGNLTGVVLVFRDRSEERRMAEALRREKEAADKANQAKSAFLANMSHEIRTPLNGIMGMVNLANMRTKESETKEYLQMAIDSAEILLDLVNDVLDLSKIEAGKILIASEPVPLQQVIEQTLEPFQVLARDKKLSFSYSIDDHLPEHVIGDAGRLRQVLNNLINNAIKFTEVGGIEVSVNKLEDPRNGKIRCGFRVRDTGIGIPADKIGGIFKSFEQAHTSASAKYGGSGLGLTISQRLVELMGGELQVESREYEGSEFYFTIDFDSAEHLSISQDSNSAKTSESRPLHLLVAEDNTANQFIVAKLLETLGHSVELAETGKEAIAKLARSHFDAVFMDIRMPEMTGDEATRLIRNDPPDGVDPDIPIIALTAYALKDEIDRFMQSGFSAYLTKPLDVAKINKVLSEL